MQVKNIDIKLLQTNNGQINGLPKNPRLIKDERFKQLVKSIQDDPEMLELRECIVYPQNEHFIVIAGNMRLRACKELKHKQIPCKVLSEETSIDKLKAYTIKDNVPFGENDMELLANEWDRDALIGWGLEIFNFDKVTGDIADEPIAYAEQLWFLNVRCNDEEHAQQLYDRFTNEGLDVKIIT